MNSRIKNLKGLKFGKLSVISLGAMSDDGHAIWVCKCDCGGTKMVQGNNLQKKSGTKSCGCLLKQRDIHPSWNKGSVYSIKGDGIYSQKHSWAKAVIKKNGSKCNRCGWDKAPCDVHHIIPKSMGGQNTIDNGEVICPNCHRIEHYGKKL